MARGYSSASSESSKTDRGLEKALDFGSSPDYNPRIKQSTLLSASNNKFTVPQNIGKPKPGDVYQAVQAARSRMYTDDTGDEYRIVNRQIAEVAKHIITETAKGKKDFSAYLEEKTSDFSYGIGTLDIGEEIVRLGVLEAKERLKEAK